MVGIVGVMKLNQVKLLENKKLADPFILDIHYAKNVSFKLDVKIIFHTIILILFHKKQYKDFNKTFN